MSTTIDSCFRTKCFGISGPVPQDAAFSSINTDRLFAQCADLCTSNASGGDDPPPQQLPAPLPSIVALSPIPQDQMLYTSSIDAFSYSSITSTGRTFLAQNSVAAQQSALSLVPGIDVQSWSSVLEGLAATNGGSVTASNMIYSTGVNTFAQSAVSAFGLTLVNVANLAALQLLVGAVSGVPATVVNRVALWNDVAATQIKNSGLAVSGGSLDILGLARVNASVEVDTPLVQNSAGGLSFLSLGGVTTIQGTPVGSAAWPFVATLDQDVATTSTPTFAGAQMSSQLITNVLDPVNPQDAATKAYVDFLATVGVPPLVPAYLATAAVLPNAPAYVNAAQTLTSTAGAGVALVVDGITLLVGDIGARILVKDQASNLQNGVYTVTDDGGGVLPWQLTRSADFNQAAVPIPAGTNIFVLQTPTASNGGSTWSLQLVVTQIQPVAGASAVIWIQIGAGTGLTSGVGIDAAAFLGGVVQTDIAARLTYTGNAIDLATVLPTYGGTGLAGPATDQVMITQGGAVPMILRPAPPDVVAALPGAAFMGTTDTQTVFAKTLTSIAVGELNDVRAGRLGDVAGTFTTNLVAPAPALNNVLTYNGANAQWLAPAASTANSYMRQVTVSLATIAPANPADFTSIQAALVAINAGTIPGGVPTVDSQVCIFVYGGTYVEVAPINVPLFVTIEGDGDGNDVIVSPSLNGVNCFSMTWSSSLRNVLVDASNLGVGGSTAIGVEITYALATIFANPRGGVTRALNVNVKNFARGFQCTGQGGLLTASGLINSSIALLRQVGVTAGTTPFGAYTGTILSAYRATNTAAMVTNLATVSGLFGAPANVTTGIVIEGGAGAGLTTFGIFNEIDISFVTTCTSVSGQYSDLRINAGNFSKFTTNGVYCQASTTSTYLGVYIADDSALVAYAAQVPLRVDTGTVVAPTIVAASGMVLRADRSVVATGSTVSVSGNSLSTQPGEPTNQFLGNTAVGFPNAGFSTSMGEGRAHTFSMSVQRFFNATVATTGTFFDNITAQVLLVDSQFSNVFPTGAVGDTLYIGSPVGQFGGIDVNMSDSLGSPLTTILPVGGNSNYAGVNGINSVEPPVYAIQWEYFAGAPFNNWVRFALMSTNTQPPFLPTRMDTWVTGANDLTHSYRFGTMTDSDQMLPVGAYTSGTSVIFTQAPWLLQAYTTNGGAGWLGTTPPSWVQTTVNGTLAYWVRCRVVAVLAANPQVNQIKLETSNTTINELGAVEYYFKARPVKRFDSGLELWSPGATNAPASSTMAVSSILGAAMTNNRFNNATTARIVRAVKLPLGVDTSHGMIVQWDWNVSTAGGGNVTWRVSWGYTTDYFLNGALVNTTDVSTVYETSGAPAPALALTESRVQFDQAALGVNRKNTTSAVQMDISNMLAIRREEGDGDVLWIAVERLGANVTDTYAGDVRLFSISLLCKYAFEGQFDA